MKIIEIHIYGYGKLENVSLKNIRDIQVFYGENEAGKSTIMSFIHSVLFGFPTRQQSELRYEPKKGSKYGGQLVLEFLEKGKVVVERVKGKATGDVSVLLENGTVGGEDLLRELLSNIDKTLFQSIFSFNLHGLQHVHHLRGEDLGRFLFSTGTIGTDRLLTVDNQLQKELEQLYKPSGKKPYINEKLKEVRTVYDQLKKAEEQNAKYGELLQEMHGLEEQINQKQIDIQRMHKEIHQLEEWKKLAPIVKEKKLLEEQLNSNTVSFPVDGISRLESIQLQQKPLVVRIKSLAEKKEQLQKELENNQPNPEILEKQSSIENVLEKLPLYDSIKEEIAEWEIKKTQILKNINNLKGKLHFPITDEKLVQCDTSIFMKEKTIGAEKKQTRIKERKVELDNQFTKERDELERIEVQLPLLKEQLLSESEREEKRQKLLSLQNRDSIERERQSTQDKLYLLQLTDKKDKERSKQNFLQYSILGIVFLFLLVLGLYQSEWLLATIGGIGASFSAYLLFRNKSMNSQEVYVQMQALKEQEKKLKEQLNNFHFSEANLIEEQLRKDSMLQEQINILAIRWEQQNAQYEMIIEAFEAWEKEALKHEELLLGLGKELHIPDPIALMNIHGAFLLIENLKECLNELHNIQTHIESKTKVLTDIQEVLHSLADEYTQTKGSSLHNTAFLLRELLKKELEKKQKFDVNLVKYEEVKEELNQLEKEYILLTSEVDSLLHLANVHTIEDFRIAGKEAEKYAVLSQKLAELTSQISISSLNEETIHELLEMEDVPLLMNELIDELERARKDNERSLQTLAEIKHRIGVLEEGGVYGELLHKYKQLQSELDLDAKEWAKLAVARELLRKTVERFKEEHLPSMLKKAEEYLSFLTDGNYVKIFLKGESSGFLIERKDHILFDANELSQATAEQVYVALRIALATTIYKKYAMPIIIDDSFVNFDHARTEKVIALLGSLTDNQILFFTCHQHLLPMFKKDSVISMKEKVGSSIHSL